MRTRAAGVGLCVAIGCGRSPLELAVAVDPTEDPGTTASDPDGTGERPPIPDLPPPEQSCEARGGRFAQTGGPWVLQSHILDFAPAYGVLPGPEELLAIWKGPFFGSDPMPNFLGARVGHDGELRSMVAPVWERPVTQEPAVHRAAEGYLVTYCGRFGADDEVTSQILDAQGNALSAEVIREPPSSCGAARPEGVWTGRVYLFAWTDNSSGELYLDVADEQLGSLGWLELATEGNLSAPPRIAVGPEGALLVAGVGRDQVHWFTLGLDGSLGGTSLLAVPAGVAPGSLAVGASPDGGFSVFLADRWEAGLYAARVVDGEPTPLVRVEGADARYEDLLLVHRPGGLLLVAEAGDEQGGTWIEAIATDDVGVPTTIEPLVRDEAVLYEAWPAVAMQGEDAWVLYTSGYQDETFDVRLARLGCLR